MRTAGLFAACGGSFYGDLILGHQPVLALEIDRWRCDVLEQRQRDGWFPHIEVVCGDVHDWSGAAYQGRVDLVHASVPCPKWSPARRGAGNPEDLWNPTARIIGEIRPEWVMLECVEGFAAEHPRIRDDLRTLGYTLSRPLILDAAALGAPHARGRYWALGHADDQGEPVLPFDDEVAELPAPEAVCWESDPRDLRMDDGLAERVERLEAVGDGVVPLCKAAAWLILTGALTASR
jgi:DNA (cytosine-5)-methyltransferase 1